MARHRRFSFEFKQEAMLEVLEERSVPPSNRAA
jgi:hypothetical protein